MVFTLYFHYLNLTISLPIFLFWKLVLWCFVVEPNPIVCILVDVSLNQQKSPFTFTISSRINYCNGRIKSRAPHLRALLSNFLLSSPFLSLCCTSSNFDTHRWIHAKLEIADHRWQIRAIPPQHELVIKFPWRIKNIFHFHWSLLTSDAHLSADRLAFSRQRVPHSIRAF